MYMALMRSYDEIIMMLILIPFSLAYLINTVPINTCGIVGSILSVACNLSPFEKIVSNSYTKNACKLICYFFSQQ